MEATKTKQEFEEEMSRIWKYADYCEWVEKQDKNALLAAFGIEAGDMRKKENQEKASRFLFSSEGNGTLHSIWKKATDSAKRAQLAMKWKHADSDRASLMVYHDGSHVLLGTGEDGDVRFAAVGSSDAVPSGYEWKNALEGKWTVSGNDCHEKPAEELEGFIQIWQSGSDFIFVEEKK